ncbi:MAG: DUF2293 domain-containing protein [Actinobacteria bacterium]|nr:DUF2293 domain-containing protein [Actinomycetota bacterium]
MPQRERPSGLVVIQPIRDWACADCGSSGDLLRMDDAGPLCLACADLGHLVFLPAGDAALTRRAGLRGSGRVGRSAAGRALDRDAITLAVVASIRHQDTDYDALLMSGLPRDAARDKVRTAIDRALATWRELPEATAGTNASASTTPGE